MHYPDHLLNRAFPTQTHRKPGPVDYFFIRHEGRNLKIRVADIEHVEARKNYSKITTIHGTYLTPVTLKRLHEMLPDDGFCQIHRSFIVSLDWVRSFDKSNVYGTDRCLPIGEGYKGALYERVVLVGQDAHHR